MLLSETKWSHPNIISINVAKEAQATFLVAGISIEPSLELLAHKEAKVARLTSSKTNAMNLPMFRIQGTNTWAQKKYIEEIIRQRHKFELSYNPRKAWDNGNEIFNITSPGCKSTTLCYSMTLKDFHSLFVGRMRPEGNENEIQEIVHEMATILHAHYPKLILSPKEYMNFGNAEKYKAQNPDIPIDSSVKITDLWQGDTLLTSGALSLFQKLNIPVEVPDHVKLSEFRSRITYLAFPKKLETIDESKAYLKKMIEEFGHLSVVAAVQVAIFIQKNDFTPKLTSALNKYAVVTPLSDGILVIVTLKELHQLLIQWASLNVDKDIGVNISQQAHNKYPSIISATYF